MTIVVKPSGTFESQYSLKDSLSLTKFHQQYGFEPFRFTRFLLRDFDQIDENLTRL